jgi:hypothetical protein
MIKIAAVKKSQITKIPVPSPVRHIISINQVFLGTYIVKGKVQLQRTSFDIPNA